MTKKIVAIFISIICVLGIIKGNVYADTTTEIPRDEDGVYDLTDVTPDEDGITRVTVPTEPVNPDDESGYVIFSPDDWKPSSTNSVGGASKLKTIGNSIIKSLKIIGAIISVVMLIVIGIKYIVGSVEEKAEYKKTMKPYLIGAVMVFAITVFLEIIQDIVGGFFE